MSKTSVLAALFLWLAGCAMGYLVGTRSREVSFELVKCTHVDAFGVPGMDCTKPESGFQVSGVCK